MRTEAMQMRMRLFINGIKLDTIFFREVQDEIPENLFLPEKLFLDSLWKSPYHRRQRGVLYDPD